MNNNEFPCFLAGIVGGAIILVSVLAFLNVNPEKVSTMLTNSSDYATMISGFGGAVLGAVIGGLISWLLARQTASEAQSAAFIKETKELKAGLLQVQLKTLQLSNNFHTMKSAIDEGAKIAAAREQPIWKFVRHSSGPNESVRFEPGDFVPLVHGDGTNLITSLSLLADRYQAASNGFREYSRLRAEFQEFSAPYTKLGPAGSMGSSTLYMTSFPMNLSNIAQLKVSELDGLIMQIQSYVDQDIEDAKILTTKVNEFATKRMKDRGDTFINVVYDWKKTPENENPAQAGSKSSGRT